MKTTIKPTAGQLLRVATERLEKMDRDTLAYLVVWFRLMAHEDIGRSIGSLHQTPVASVMAPIYESVSNLIQQSARVTDSEVDRILYGFHDPAWPIRPEVTK